jgi:hypothetical protein
MPERDLVSGAFEYPIPKAGLNIHGNFMKIRPDEALRLQNLRWENGLKMRGGQAFFDSNQVVANKSIVGLHRFYKSDGTTQTLAAADTVVKYSTGSGWTNVKTGLTTGLQTYMSTWGSADEVYGANGTDAPWKWDGSSVSAVAAAPADTLQFLPFRDRLLSLTGGDVTWSAAFDDTSWGTVANIGVRPDTNLNGMVIHAVNDENVGQNAKVLLAGDNGMYLLQGTDLRWPATTGDYSIIPLAINVGCNSPRTMCWTPRGTMFLGIDRQVYMVPFDSVSPVPVGTKIQSNLQGIRGIESIPAGQINGACAVYHDGFYKLSVAQQGGTNNTQQFWLDVRIGPWYGPMAGQSIGVFALQGGSGDSGILMGGEDTAKGYVYTLHDPSVFNDIDPSDGSSQAITTIWQSFFNPLGNESVMKDISFTEHEILKTDDSVTITFKDIDSTSGTVVNLNLPTSATKWGASTWGSFLWQGFTPDRVRTEVNPVIRARTLSVTTTHNTSTKKYEIYGFRVKATQQHQTFEL